eukprot:10496053-Karenia_brevis.AAC.1
MRRAFAKVALLFWAMCLMSALHAYGQSVLCASIQFSCIRCPFRLAPSGTSAEQQVTVRTSQAIQRVSERSGQTP